MVGLGVERGEGEGDCSWHCVRVQLVEPGNNRRLKGRQKVCLEYSKKASHCGTITSVSTGQHQQPVS